MATSKQLANRRKLRKLVAASKDYDQNNIDKCGIGVWADHLGTFQFNIATEFGLRGDIHHGEAATLFGFTPGFISRVNGGPRDKTEFLVRLDALIERDK